MRDRENPPPIPVRPMQADDLPAMKRIIDATGLFPSDLLDGMTEAWLRDGPGSEIWLVAEQDGVAGLAYAAPERMTDGTWNLYLIAVDPAAQGSGVGLVLVMAIEAMLAAIGVRLLLVETSGLPEFERTRRFYRGCGYREEARIREFYKAGEDKVVFARSLA